VFWSGSVQLEEALWHQSKVSRVEEALAATLE
jgi:hypothetical protein